MLEIRF